MPEIRAKQKQAYLEMQLQAGMSLVFSQDGSEVQMDEQTPENKAFPVSRMQLRRRAKIVTAAVCTFSHSFASDLRIQNAQQEISCSFCTRTGRQTFTIPQNVTRLTLEFVPETGFTLRYDDAAEVYEDPMASFLTDPPQTHMTPVFDPNTDTAQLRSDLEQQAAEKMRLMQELERLRKQAAENERALSLLRSEAEKIKEMREHHEEQAYLDRLLRDLDIDKDLMEQYQNAPTGSETESQLFDMLAVQCAAVHETVRQLMALRQSKADLKGVSAPKQAGEI